jgi:hypothetical protein
MTDRLAGSEKNDQHVSISDLTNCVEVKTGILVFKRRLALDFIRSR